MQDFADEAHRGQPPREYEAPAHGLVDGELDLSVVEPSIGLADAGHFVELAEHEVDGLLHAQVRILGDCVQSAADDLQHDGVELLPGHGGYSSDGAHRLAFIALLTAPDEKIPVRRDLAEVRGRHENRRVVLD